VNAPTPRIFDNHHCRVCSAPLTVTFVDLGVLPLCQTYPRAEDLERMEPFYPLHAHVCSSCFLTQLPVYVKPEEIFTEYAYFSSHSDSWLNHVKSLAGSVCRRFGLGSGDYVVEAASNDGYLLQYFQAHGLRVLGVEPAVNVARVANERGIPTLPKFFCNESARQLRDDGIEADLLVALNVLDHVPDLVDFVAGMRLLIKPHGVVMVEFPHLCQLIDHNEFDTIYHDRFSYLSFTTVEHVFRSQGLAVFDVEELPTHGGSLRVFARRAECLEPPVEASVDRLLAEEAARGVKTLRYYRAFNERVVAIKFALLEFLIAARRAGKSIVGYGIPAKGNVLLNYCGIRTDFLDYVVDRSPYKQGKFTPGTRIPILPVSRIPETRPDYLLILPWNIKEEIMDQMAEIRSWGGRFVVPVPSLQVL
jgi:SAM-dependent methyltransferase